MSLIVTAYSREWIVMAGDSRVVATVRQSGPNQTLPLGATEADGNYNVFLTQKDVGISTFGAGEISNVPVGTYVESFINHEANRNSLDVCQTADEIIRFFQKFKLQQSLYFHVAGYQRKDDALEAQVWEISISEGRKKRMNDPVPHGAAWGGESDIADRLLQPLYDADPDGNAVEVPHFKIPWGHVSNQDAADFASAVISTTATMMRFQSRPKSVGGPIDILVLKPGLAQWLQRKETLASQMSKEGYVQGKQRTVIDLGRKK